MIRPFYTYYVSWSRICVNYISLQSVMYSCECMLKRLFGRSSEDSRTSATGSYYFARPISNVTLDLAERQRGDRLNDDEY